MSFSQELWDTFRKLAALEARTEDVVRSLERVEGKIDGLLERVSRVEIQYQNLRENVRNEILAGSQGRGRGSQVRLRPCSRDQALASGSFELVIGG